MGVRHLERLTSCCLLFVLPTTREQQKEHQKHQTNKTKQKKETGISWRNYHYDAEEGSSVR